MPRMARDVTTLPPVPAQRRMAYGKAASQFFDVWMPSGAAAGSVIFIHGGFWRARYDLTHASHLCSALAKQGFACASLEYRRAGNGGGWPASFEDVTTGLRAAHERFDGLAVIVGHSAGGHLALRLAAEQTLPIVGALALAPVADLQLAYELHLSNDAVVEFLRGTPAQIQKIYEAADPMRHPAVVPCKLIHGTADDVVPIALSRSYVTARTHDPNPPKLVELPAVSHMDIIDPESSAFEEIVKVIRVLQPA